MTDLHLHFHFSPTGDIPLPLFNDLKETLTMNNAELKTTLENLAAIVTAGLATLRKATDEIVVALSNQGNTSPEVDAALAALQAAVSGLAPVAQALDDLNPDAPAAP